MKLLIICLFASLASAQGISNQWFVVDKGGYTNSEQECYKPANVAVSSGLTITAKSQTLACGDTLNAPKTFSYSSGQILANNYSFKYGVQQYTVTTPAAIGHTGMWPVVWMIGAGSTSTYGVSGCQTFQKTGGTAGVANCNPVWPTTGSSEEIDTFESFGNAFSSPCSSAPCIDQGVHNTQCSGNSCLQYSSVAASTTYTVVVDWTSGHLNMYVNGTQTYTNTTHVPSAYMMMLVDIAIGGSSGSPAGISWPQTLGLGYMRVCPIGTLVGGNPGCDATTAQGTGCGSITGNCFDDEFNQTGPNSNIYTAQTWTGQNTGYDCADALGLNLNGQISIPNDAGYWQGNGGAAQIGPGTSINLCGTISTTLNAQGSGTSGSPITFNFLAGSSGTASANGQSFINIQGPPSGSFWGGNTKIGGNVTVH